MAPVDFYFDYRSPYSYLALTQLDDVELRLLPVDVVEVMRIVGNVPTTVTCAAKGRYAMADLGRWARRYRQPVARHPDGATIDARRLLRATLAVEDGPHRRTTAKALFAAMWATGAPLSRVEDVLAVLAGAGVDAAQLADRIDGPELAAELDAATASAAERGVFGVPTMVAGGEMFFGNDRLDFLREHLEASK